MRSASPSVGTFTVYTVPLNESPIVEVIPLPLDELKVMDAV